MGTYGFRKKDSLEKLIKKEIPRPKNSQAWFTTKDIVEGKNHCGSILGANLILYYKDFLNEKSPLEEAYRLVGNGPIIFLAKKLRPYFIKKGYYLKTRPLKGEEAIKEALKNKRPLIILLEKNPLNWHWVLGLDYLEDSLGFFIEIADGWSRESTYYKINEYSRAWYIREVWIEKIDQEKVR